MEDSVPAGHEAAPGDGDRIARDYWYLAQAYLAAHAYGKALEVVEAGLARAPRGWALIATRGDARDGLGDDEGASADWQLAVELRRNEVAAGRGTA